MPSSGRTTLCVRPRGIEGEPEREPEGVCGIERPFTTEQIAQRDCNRSTRSMCVGTELEWQNVTVTAAQFEEIAQVSSWITDSSRVVVLTGAGISTDSGIPDFRGPKGLWTKNPLAEKMSDIRYYLADQEVRKLAWQNRLLSPVWTVDPNPGHHALVDLERRGKLHTLVTQNVDELHQKAGTNPERVVEVHGTMGFSRCWDCGDRLPMKMTLDRVVAGEEDPPCRECGGILKSDTISFGQALIPEVIDRALRVAEECEVLLCIGTTLAVGPVNNMVPRAKYAGAKIAIVNGDPTEMDSLADVVIFGGISQIVPMIVAGIENLTN